MALEWDEVASGGGKWIGRLVISSLDIAWAAGLYEGEGFTQTINGKNRGIRARIVQKDPWILQRMQTIFGGTLHPHRHAALSKDDRFYWLWSLYGAQARGFLLTIYIFLSHVEKVRSNEHYNQGGPGSRVLILLGGLFARHGRRRT